MNNLFEVIRSIKPPGTILSGDFIALSEPDSSLEKHMRYFDKYISPPKSHPFGYFDASPPGGLHELLPPAGEGWDGGAESRSSASKNHTQANKLKIAKKSYLQSKIQILILIYLATTIITSNLYALELGPNNASALQINLSGTQALRSGDFKRALDEIGKDTSKSGIAFKAFKLGVIQEKMGNSGKAISNFRSAADKDKDLAPFVFQHIGDIEQSNSRKENALNAYKTSLNFSPPQAYRQILFNKIRPLVENDASFDSVPWLDEFRLWTLQQKPTVKRVIPDTLDSLLRAKAWAEADSFLITCGALDNGASCSVLKAVSVSGMPDSFFSTLQLFNMAVNARSCKQKTSADKWLSASQQRSDFDVAVPKERVLAFNAQVQFDKGNFEEAIKLYKKYIQKFGNISDIVMAIARSYKKLDQTKDAAEWYKKHVQLYPQHPRTEEIVWLLAWMEEEMGKYNESVKYYKKIYSEMSSGKRAEESYLRHALCFYRAEKYDSALSMLNRYTVKFKEPNIATTVLFWQGKCGLALDKTSDAIGFFTSIIKKDPADYYAYRARQLLLLLGDTTKEFSIDTIADQSRAHRWLDSISPPVRKSFTHADTVNLKLGAILASVGFYDQAEIYLSSYEDNWPNNLDLQFDLATMYGRTGSPQRAFRVSRRLAWRIPQECRSSMPSDIYAILYPPYYSDIIRSEADRFDVDPHLVRAVIRQESIFNPGIVSSAGAVGLMQIMPTTGTVVAPKAGMNSFVEDSLYYPSVNIRLGTYYLRELLDQFKENLVLAIASYNGGPHNAVKWYEQNKNEEYDLFIEDIGFSETRGYVKKVLANYWTYRFLSRLPSFGDIKQTYTTKG